MNQKLITEEAKDDWTELKEPKQFSRLLYTNPVCFLSTITTNDEQKRNVMIISWLTATNNEGQFIMSVNKRRHTASVLLLSGCEFSLSVPIKGMEELVRQVGRASGKWGSKFIVEDHAEPGGTGSCLKDDEDVPQPRPMSKRQKKKQEASQRGSGVPGLAAVPFGHQEPSSLFCVKGTIAHLACRVYKVMPEDDVDKDHHLILAQVTQAFVHSSYWDADKNLFRPESSTVPPYLTFFGSQTFGYVVAE